MSKHTLDELKQWQSLPLPIKVRMTETRTQYTKQPGAKEQDVCFVDLDAISKNHQIDLNN